MNAYHDLRSVRSWLNGLYPDMSILVQRNVQGTGKPYFFIQELSDTFEDQGYGFHNTVRVMRIHLVHEDSGNPDGKQETFWNTKRVLEFLKEQLLTERVIPHYLYSFNYPTPTINKISGGDVLPKGYRLAVSAVCQGTETLLSAEVIYQLNPGGFDLLLSIPNWPTQRPIADGYVVYRREDAGGAWEAIQEIDVSYASYSTDVRINTAGLASISPTRNPVTSSRIYIGMLKVMDASCSMLESVALEDAFSGYVQFRMISRHPHVRPGAPVIHDVSIGP